MCVFMGGWANITARYHAEALLDWCAWMTEQADAGRPVWAYFNNDAEAAAIQDALSLKAMVEQRHSL